MLSHNNNNNLYNNKNSCEKCASIERENETKDRLVTKTEVDDDTEDEYVAKEDDGAKVYDKAEDEDETEVDVETEDDDETEVEANAGFFGYIRDHPVPEVDASSALQVIARGDPKTFCVADCQADRRSWRRLPWFLLINCLLQVSIYLWADDCFHQLLLFVPEHRSTQWWRLLSYTLLHSDPAHLLLNVCLQVVVGVSLELEQGHFRVALIYVAGGVSGSLATWFLQPQLSLLGASAGVYALLMSHVPHLVKNFPVLSHRYFRLVSLVILCLSDAGFTSFHFVVNRNENPRICLEAHVAGAASGLLLGFAVYRRMRRKRGYHGGHRCGGCSI